MRYFSGRVKNNTGTVSYNIKYCKIMAMPLKEFEQL